MKTARFSSAARDLFDALEPRQLLATFFNPDGPVIATPSEAPSSVITADFDGDSKPDLITAVGHDILFQKGGGGGKFGAPRLLARLNTNAGLLGAGDFNGDGITDLFSVEKETLGGWRRVFINSGEASFSSASYGRVQTLVESVTIGNIDGDAQDEVLLKGRSPWLVLGGSQASDIIGEAPDEIRVLDPIFPVIFFRAETDTSIPASPYRLVDRGVAFEGYKLAKPVIAPMVQSDVALPFIRNSVIVGGQDPLDASKSYLQVYTYNNPFVFFPLAAGSTPALFSAVGDKISIDGIVSSIAGADMNNDSKPDIVATTLAYPTIPGIDSISQSEFQARTILLSRSGDAADFQFDAPVTLESRTLALRPLTRRATLPDYTIVGIADFNSDGFKDVGLSVVQEFVGGRNGSVRDASFVQLTRPDLLSLPPSSGLYFSSYVSHSLTTGIPTESVFSRPQLFTLGDVRNIGRPDLIVANTPTSKDSPTLSILFNVQARAIIPLIFNSGAFIGSHLFVQP